MPAKQNDNKKLVSIKCHWPQWRVFLSRCCWTKVTCCSWSLFPLRLSADDLELREKSGDSSVVTCRDLHPDTTWGPYPGILQSEGNTADGETEVSPILLAFCVYGPEVLIVGQKVHCDLDF